MWRSLTYSIKVILLTSVVTPCLFSQTYKIWPLGNSITEGTGTDPLSGYRKPLYTQLKNYANTMSGVDINFVGTIKNDTNDNTFDHDHDGHAGKLSSYIRGNIDSWLTALQNSNELPDFVLFHIGTNDVSSNRSATDIRADIEASLDIIWGYRPNMRVFLCGIIPRIDDKNDQTYSLNDQIWDIVNDRRNSEGKLIYYIDQYWAFRNYTNWESALMYNSSDPSDYLHPNSTGYQVMADRFYSTVSQYIVPGGTPVELFTFNAISQDFEIKLNWSTLSESNNLGFYIEHSFGEQEFEEIGFVDGNGTTTLQQNYDFAYQTNLSGLHKFRLRQVDSDGTTSYSNEISVTVEPPASFVLHQNYPNPFNPAFSANGGTQIRFDLSEEAPVKITIFDMLGRSVAELAEGEQTAGRHEINWNGRTETGQLAASGTYLISMRVGDQYLTKRLQLLN